MTDNTSNKRAQNIYRVDKFAVPNEAREEFMQQVNNTHNLLRSLPGFQQDFLLEQSTETSEFNFITIVEWDSMESIHNARAAVLAMQQASNFNPQEALPRLGIKADIGNYQRVAE